MRAFFDDADFNFLTEIALGAVFHRAADTGEVLTTVDRIQSGNPQSWVSAWTDTASRLQSQALAAEKAAHRYSAAAELLRVSMYFALATYSADGAGDADLFPSLWEKHRTAWDRFVELQAPSIEHIAIPYEQTSLEAYFFRAGGVGERRRTLIFNNGSDGAVTAAWVQGIADALARGWNAVTFDGPGQNASLVRQHLWFRPDWERVITPVVDYLHTRPDVDAERLALLGVSQGGYWVPRAVAFEHRIAAAVADPGVIDVSAAMLSHLPDFMVRMLDQGDKEQFDRDMELSLSTSPETRALLGFRMRPYGTTSTFDFFTAARAYTLSAETVQQISCPVLVTNPEREQFWPGQAQQLYDLLPGSKAMVAFTEAEGADGHCEPAANAIRGERIFDWLDEQIPG
ncbi:MAG: prolyl oligopeptidase family serine peptidase [Chloroflexi bacterium]|nr:prolyl oligopeptidase family serine peptidase [Chloroflexota bacterium]